MNRLRAAELLPIITAFANGEDIQKNDRIMVNDAFNKWYDTDDITGKGEYRIKPKPRAFWIAPDSADINGYGNFRRGDDPPVAKTGWIKVREVL